MLPAHRNVRNAAKDEAVKRLLKRAMRKYPNCGEVHLQHGLWHFRRLDYHEALQSFKTALDLLADAGTKRLHGLRAELLSLVAQCTLALEHTTRSAHIATEHLCKVQSLYIESLEHTDDTPAILNNLGHLYLCANNNSGACKIFEQISKSLPNYLDAINNRGLALMGLQEFAEATKCFQTVLFSDVKHFEALTNYGVVLIHHKLYPYAAEVLQRAVKVDPSHSFVWRNLAVAHSGQGKWNQAMDACEMALSLEPRSYAIRRDLACAMLSNASSTCTLESTCYHDIRTAKQMLSDLLQEQNDSTACIALAEACKLECDMMRDDNRPDDSHAAHSEMMSTIDKATTIDSKDLMPWMYLGKIALEKGDYVQAQELYKRAVQHDSASGWSRSAAAFCNLGIALQLDQSKADSQAEKILLFTIEMAPDAYQVYNNLGNLYRQQRRFHEASMMYEKCLEVNPNHADAYNNLALLFIQTQRFPQARDLLRKALELQPGFEVAKSNILKLEMLMKRWDMHSGTSRSVSLKRKGMQT